MAGFTKKKYQADSGNIYYVRLDSRNDVLAVAGAEPGGAVTEDMTLVVSRSSRSFGLHPRYAVFSRPLGGGLGQGTNTEEDPLTNDELGYVTEGKAYKYVPILTEAAATALTTNTTINLSGVTFTWVRNVKEEAV